MKIIQPWRTAHLLLALGLTLSAAGCSTFEGSKTSPEAVDTETAQEWGDRMVAHISVDDVICAGYVNYALMMVHNNNDETVDAQVTMAWKRRDGVVAGLGSEVTTLLANSTTRLKIYMPDEPMSWSKCEVAEVEVWGE